MSKLNDLIARLCPNGVEYVKLGDCCSFKRGTTITEKNAVSGSVPVLAGGQKPAYYHNVANRDGETIVIAGSGAYAGFVSFWTIPVFLSDSFSVEPDDRLLVKYVYYFLKNIQQKIFGTKRGSGVPHVHGKSIANFEVPVPPVEVQEEIVRILDKFTQLEAELEAELDCRKRQYEYYRDQLLSFSKSSKNVTTARIGDIGKIRMCKRILKRQTNSEGGIPFYKISTFGNAADAYISNELYERYKASYPYPQKGDILISAAGTIGKTVVFDGKPSYFQDSNIVWIENDQSTVLNSYLNYYYKTIEWQTQGGTIKRLYNDLLANTTIKYPPMEEQRRIVEILDRFEALSTSLQSGLPAEIAARRQQYEYYRDRLLTFKRKVS